jgi:hypothetical protein
MGQKDPSYGFASLNEASRQATLMDACAALQPCRSLSEQGVRIRNVVVQTGQRAGGAIPHAISFYRSLVDLHGILSAVLPDTALAVEVTDTLPLDHPIPFPAAKKASLGLTELIRTLAAVNRVVAPGKPISLMVNWGRLLVNGDRPLDGVQQILASEVPLAGVILSGAGASPNGFMDSHNSHLDPDSGFTIVDLSNCAAVLKASSQPSFLGMKCSRAKGSEQVSVEEVLAAQAKLLGQVG